MLRTTGRIAASALACAAFTATPAQAKLLKIATFPSPGTLAADDGWVALTQATENGATLLVGRLGATPVAVPAAKGLPSWARPHIGTDDHGRVVVVYPTCAGSDCDLHAYDPDRETDRPVPGGATDGNVELEGDLDRGALAVAIKRKDTPRVDSTGSVTTKLAYRPAGGKMRVLTNQGGLQVALDRGRILTVRSVYGTDRGGECGVAQIELTRTTGQRKEIAHVSCGEDFQRVSGLGFIAKQRVAWGVTTASGSIYRQLDLTGGARERSVRALGGFIACAPLNATYALVLQGDAMWSLAPRDPEDEGPAPTYPLVQVDGIHVGAKDASGQR